MTLGCDFLRDRWPKTGKTSVHVFSVFFSLSSLLPKKIKLEKSEPFLHRKSGERNEQETNDVLFSREKSGRAKQDNLSWRIGRVIVGLSSRFFKAPHSALLMEHERICYLCIYLLLICTYCCDGVVRKKCRKTPLRRKSAGPACGTVKGVNANVTGRI